MNTAMHRRTFALVLLRETPALELTLFRECLNYANWFSGHTLYTCDAVAFEPGLLENRSELWSNPAIVQNEIGEFDLVVVFGHARPTDNGFQKLSAWLHHQARQGALIGSIAKGARALAHCGLLKGQRVALPRSSFAAFSEEFPDIEVTPELYVIDNHRFSCCGGTATLDLALHLIASQHGSDLAYCIADACVYDFLARTEQRQHSLMEARLIAADRRLYKAIKLMNDTVETPLPIERIARMATVSVRQLQRLFRHYLSTSPCHYYMRLRLWCARSLLLETDLSVTEISIATGFVSHSGFSTKYRQTFGKSPSQERSNEWNQARHRALGSARFSPDFCNVTSGGMNNDNIRTTTA